MPNCLTNSWNHWQFRWSRRQHFKQCCGWFRTRNWTVPNLRFSLCSQTQNHMCANLQGPSALDPRGFPLLAHWLPAATGLLRCHQFEAQQMILAAASLVQLGLHGSVPPRATKIRGEKDTEREGKENSKSCQSRRKKIKKEMALVFLYFLIDRSEISGCLRAL